MSWTGELTLEEMLRDPIVRLVMRRDGVTAREVRRVMKRVRSAGEGDREAVEGAFSRC